MPTIGSASACAYHLVTAGGFDLDGDGDVQGAGFELFRRQFGRRPGP